MKTLIKRIFFVLYFFIFGPISIAQYFINQFDGIPIIIGVPDDISIIDYDKMDEMGADFVITKDLTQNRLNEIKLRNLNFKVIPAQTKITPPNLLYNYIMSYTEGAYTLWEAEGTPLGKGEATLKYNQNVCTTFVEGSRKGIKTLPGAGYDTLITGPGYSQEIRYWRLEENYLDSIFYTAEFNMKLEYNSPPQNLNPNDTICIIQVTDSNIECCYTATQIFERSRAILRGEFISGQWQTFILNYELTDAEDINLEGTSIQLPHSTNINYHSLDPINKNAADFIQFKVIWYGDQYSKLFVDNVILFDDKGKDIKILPAAQQNIIDQATLSFNTSDNENYITAWFALDEPETIDNYEPIRIIDSLLKSASNGKRGLWVSFPSSWNGKYGDSHLGAQSLFKSKEFLLRTGLSPHQNNHPLYHYPFTASVNPWGGDFRKRNIEVLGDSIMRKVRDWDPNFSMTLICGRYLDAYLEHDPLPHEMLYEANLKLIYGAKSLSFYRYYGDPDNPDITGLVVPMDDSLVYTPKWTMVRDILSPRLKGLFGKTIKKLVPTEQHLNIDASSYYNFISHFSGNLECLPSTSDYDLGFFTDSLSRDYFMIISRYYNQSGACPIYINFDESSINNNLVLTKFAADTTYNILRSDPIPVNLTRGDAELYRIYPVVRWGGQLLANDTIYAHTTLTDDMSISAGAKLFIKAGKFYTIQDTVILNGTGQQPNWGFITGDGYLDVAQCGEVIANNWAYSLFKGKQSNHPKLFWSKFTGSDHTGYKIYRKKETPGFVEIATLSNTARTYIDTTVVVIDGQAQSNEVVAEYYVKAIYDNGRSSSNSNTITYKRVEGSAWEKLSTGLTRDNFTYQLQQNYPNPFNPVTQISYSIENDGLVELEVLNILGERVASLVSEHKTKGSYTIPFDASQLSSGIYIYRLRSKDFVSSKKMLLLK